MNNSGKMYWTRQQSSIIGVVTVTSFMGTFLFSSVNIALPAIEKTFSLDAIRLSWVVTAFLLASAMFLLPVGRWGDLRGIRRLYRLGLAIFTLATLLCGLSGSGTWLILFRFLQGIGAALTNTTGPAILVSAFMPRHRGRVLGISVSAVYIGLAFGPFAGGMLTQYLGWRSIFYTATILGLLTLLIAYRYLGRDIPPEERGKKIDLRGTFIYMLGLIALVYGSSRIPTLPGWLMMGGGVIFLLIFWMIESRAEMPVIETRLFTRNRLFAFSNLAALINYSATFSIVFLLSLYLQKIHGLSPRDAGTILITQPVMMAIFSPIAGRLSDRFEPRFFTTMGMTICTIGLALFTRLTADTSLVIIVALLAWVGLGFALFSSPNMNTIMSSVDRTRYGIASGTAASMRVIGQIISMTIATFFFAALLGRQVIETAPDHLFLKAVQWGFTSFAIISIAGIYFSYYRGKVGREVNP